jgi:hypothetical protein
MKIFSLSLVLALIVCVPASAQVTIVGEWVEGLTHAAPAGTDRLLVFIAPAEDDDDSPTVTVTYGGQTMTPVIEQSQIGDDLVSADVFAFILNESGIAAASGDNFDPTWTGLIDLEHASYISVFLSGVNQDDPIGASSGAGVIGEATVTADPLATAAGDMVIVAATHGGPGNEYTLNNGFTVGVHNEGVHQQGVAGYKAATGANETPSATHGGGNRQVIVGFVVQGEAPTVTISGPHNVATGTTPITLTAAAEGFDDTPAVTYTWEDDSTANPRDLVGLGDGEYKYSVVASGNVGTVAATAEASFTLWVGVATPLAGGLGLGLLAGACALAGVVAIRHRK